MWRKISKFKSIEEIAKMSTNEHITRVKAEFQSAHFVLSNIKRMEI